MAGENRTESHNKIDGSHDRRYDDNGQGAVKDPAHDGRLKENRESGTSMQDKNDEKTSSSKSHAKKK